MRRVRHMGIVESFYDRRLAKLLPRSRVRSIWEPESLSDEEAEVFGEWGREDLYFFLYFVCGQVRMGAPGPGRFHWEWCRGMQEVRKPRLDVKARGMFKTTIAGKGRPLWAAVRDPENFDQIIVVSDIGLGRDILDWIRRQVTHNRRFRRLYPEIKPDPLMWGQDRARLSKRGTERTGPTWQVKTYRQQFAGQHVAAIHFDDWENDRNATSRAEQEELLRAFNDVWPELDTDCLTGSGTPYSDYGFTAQLIRERAPHDLEVHLQPLRGRAVLNELGEIEVEDDGSYVFPEEWDDERFEAKRRQVGNEATFQFQYMLNTKYVEESGFQAEWIQYFRVGEEPRVTRYMALDPASGTGTTRPAIGVLGVGESGEKYVLFSSSQYSSEPEAVEDLFRLYEVYRPARVGIERFSQGGHSMYNRVQEESRRRRMWLPLEPMTGAGDKDARIRAALWFDYYHRRVWHHPGLRGSEYERELLGYTGKRSKALLRDEVDAMSRCFELAAKYGYREVVAVGPKVEKVVLRPRGREKRGYTLEELLRPKFPRSLT